MCGKHSSIVDIGNELGRVQEIWAPCAVFCCLWLSGAVSCVVIRVRYGE